VNAAAVAGRQPEKLGHLLLYRLLTLKLLYHLETIQFFFLIVMSSFLCPPVVFIPQGNILILDKGNITVLGYHQTRSA